MKPLNDLRRASIESSNLLLVLSVALALAACGGGGRDAGSSSGIQPPATFTVSATTIGSGGGTISPNSVSVTHGSTATFSITPSAGQDIASVSGCGGTLNGTTYTTGLITAACSVTVNFGPSSVTPQPTSGSLVTLNPSVPPNVLPLIAHVVAPTGTGHVGDSIQYSSDSPTGQSLVLAVDNDSQIVLASMIDSDSTSLSQESTAVALVRVAVGALDIGVEGRNFDSSIRSTAGFDTLVDEISLALTNGVAPGASPVVLAKVGEVLAMLQPAVTAAVSDTLVLRQGLWTPTVAGLPFELVRDAALSGRQSVRIRRSYSGGFIELDNSMPIPWSASTFTAFSASANTPIETIIIESDGRGENLIDGHPYGYNLLIGQTAETREKIALALMTDTVRLALSVTTPSSCTQAVLISAITARIQADPNVSWDGFMEYFDEFYSLSNITNQLQGCVDSALVGEFFLAINPYIRALRLANATVVGFGLVNRFRYAQEYWNVPDQEFGVCVSAQGTVVNCAINFDFTLPDGSACGNNGLAMAPGAEYVPVVRATDNIGQATPLPSGLVFESSDPSVVSFDPGRGVFTAERAVNESATISVSNLISSPLVRADCPVNVILPTVSPETVTMKIPPADLADRVQTFTLTDGNDGAILVPPGIVWQVTPVDQQSIFPLTSLSYTDVTTWTTTSDSLPGEVFVEALDPISIQPYSSASVNVVAGEEEEEEEELHFSVAIESASCVRGARDRDPPYEGQTEYFELRLSGSATSSLVPTELRSGSFGTSFGYSCGPFCVVMGALSCSGWTRELYFRGVEIGGVVTGIYQCVRREGDSERMDWSTVHFLTIDHGGQGNSRVAYAQLVSGLRGAFDSREVECR